jgi:GTPase SAR1 family protein
MARLSLGLIRLGDIFRYNRWSDLLSGNNGDSFMEKTNSEVNRLKVFLCHASQDKEYVRGLYKQLQAMGAIPWLDEINILPGQDWNYEIRKSIKNSDVIIVCISNRSVNKAGYVQKEISYALDIASEQPEGSIFLIPAQIEKCDIPEKIKSIQCAKVYEEGGYNLLIESLRVRAIQLNRILESNNNTSKANNISDNESSKDNFDWKSTKSYFRDAFSHLFWDQYPELGLKVKNEFSVAIVGETGVGKTSLAVALSGKEYEFPRWANYNDMREEGYKYRIPFKDSIYFTDHSGYMGDDINTWNKLLDYLKDKADLILFLKSSRSDFNRSDMLILDTLKKLDSTPVVLVVSQLDSLDQNMIANVLDVICRISGFIPLPISVLEGRNLSLLIEFILKAKKMYSSS